MIRYASTLIDFQRFELVRNSSNKSNQATHNENPPYAVKRLRANDYDAFNAEVSNLKRFSAKDHLHLIKLLVTFSRHDQYYLLFPWADGNLLDFWKLYPKPSEPNRDYQLEIGRAHV